MNKPQLLTRANELGLLHKRAYWSNIVAEWQKKPISPAIFCQNKNINKEQFYYWRRKVNKITKSTVQKEGAFVELTAQEATITNKNSLIESSKSFLEILLPNKINIMVTIPTVDIGQVIQQLAGRIAC